MYVYILSINTSHTECVYCSNYIIIWLSLLFHIYWGTRRIRHSLYKRRPSPGVRCVHRASICLILADLISGAVSRACTHVLAPNAFSWRSVRTQHAAMDTRLHRISYPQKYTHIHRRGLIHTYNLRLTKCIFIFIYTYIQVLHMRTSSTKFERCGRRACNPFSIIWFSMYYICSLVRLCVCVSAYIHIHLYYVY